LTGFPVSENGNSIWDSGLRIEILVIDKFAIPNPQSKSYPHGWRDLFFFMAKYFPTGENRFDSPAILRSFPKIIFTRIYFLTIFISAFLFVSNARSAWRTPLSCFSKNVRRARA
jgi:hypothetical protein